MSAPVLVIISGNSLVFPWENDYPALVFTGAAPRRASASSGTKSVSHITPFSSPFWDSKCQEMEGGMKNQGEKKKRKQKRTNSQDMKSTHLLGGCLLVFDCETVFFFEIFDPSVPA